MTEPLIPSARLRLSGTSSESFDNPPKKHDIVILTIRAECVEESSKIAASGGDVDTRAMKVLSVAIGGDTSLFGDSKPDEPSLFDSDPATTSDDESSSNVVGIGQGPQFSAGD